MKKIFLTLAVSIFMSTLAFADYKNIDNTRYYYDNEEKTINWTNDKGDTESKGKFTWVETLNGKLYAADDTTGLRGLMDMQLNTVIPFKYTDITYNAHTQAYECINQNEKVIEFYDREFNKIPQPLNIEKIENTNYYKQVVVTENAPDEILYYICDIEGNRLIEQPFENIEGAAGSIIAVNTDLNSGVYDKELEIAIPFGKYTSIWYDNGRFRCHNSDTGETVFLSDRFEPAEEVNDIFGTDYYYKKGDNGLYYICDFDGNVLKDKGYYEINNTGGRILVRSSDTYPLLYGLLDENLNEAIDEKYLRIYYDNETGETSRYLNAKIEYYDRDNNLLRTEDGPVFVTPIKGMEGRSVYDQYPDGVMPGEHSCFVIDDKGNALTGSYYSIGTEAQPGNTLIINSIMGHSDIIEGLLDSDMKVIVPPGFGNVFVKEEDGAIYVENVWEGSDTKYYDLYGNQYKTKAEALAAAKTKGEPSLWAKESIEKAITVGIVPEEIQSQYIRNITRQEFCKLAVMTYIAKTNYAIENNAENPFIDVNDDYVTAAYNLKIVAGLGKGVFAPDKSITRQEAAVMLDNLAKLLNVKGTEKTVKFTDESYFATWSRAAIYSVAAMKSGDTYVMAGTGEGKFSPWMNYTREQAIATMWRLYNCEAAPSETKAVESEDLELIHSYHVGYAREPEVSQNYDVIMDKEGNIIADYPVIMDIGCGVYVYKTFNTENNYGLIMGLLDKHGKVVVEAQYEDKTTWAYNDTVTFKKGDTYYVYDTEGNLKGSMTYKLPDFKGTAAPYCVDSISGTNVVVRRWQDRYGMYGADPDMDWYIYRLYSKEKTADDYFNIRITDNGEFIANDLNDNKACVLDANGKLKLKTDFCTMYRVDKGLYFARSEYDKYQGHRKYFPEGDTDKVTFLDGDFNVIAEGIDNVEYEVDEENKIVKATKNNEPFEIKY